MFYSSLRCPTSQVFQDQQKYDLNFTSQPPSKMRYQIQERSDPNGNPNDWAIFRIPFPIPNTIRVEYRNGTSTSFTELKPIPINNGTPADLEDYTDQCGANVYHYEQAIIEFLVNGKDNCQVRLAQTNHIRLTARLEIPIADFYSNDGATTFLTNICAFLGIDTARLKIVGINEGSTIVSAVLDTDGTGTTQEDQALLQDYNERLSNGATDGTLNVGSAILELNSDYYVYNEDGTLYSQSEEKEEDNTMIIIIAVTVPVVVIVLAVAGFCYYKRKRSQIHDLNELNNNSSVHRETIKGTTDFDISAIEDFEATNYGKK